MDVYKELVKIASEIDGCDSSKRFAARKNNKNLQPFPYNDSDYFRADKSQREKLVDILGPENLYGGGIIDARFKPEIKMRGDSAAVVHGTLVVLCNGDFDEDEYDGQAKWLKFNVGGGLDFHRRSSEDGDDFTGWERNDIVETDNTDEQIVNAFEEDIVYALDSMM